MTAVWIDTADADAAEAPPRAWAGFWRRSLAVVVDLVIVGMVVGILATLLSMLLPTVPIVGPAVGLMLVLLYFGLLDSRYGNGSTLGKDLFRIHVVGGAGQMIGFFRATARFLVFIPIALPTVALLAASVLLGTVPLPAAIPALPTDGFLGAVAALAVLGFAGIASVLLVAFGGKGGRAIHDRLTGTGVMPRSRPAGPPPAGARWRTLLLLLVAAPVTAIAIAFPMFLLSGSLRPLDWAAGVQSTLAAARSVTAALGADEQIADSGVVYGAVPAPGDDPWQPLLRTITVQATLAAPEDDPVAMHGAIAKAVAAARPAFEAYARLFVAVTAADGRVTIATYSADWMANPK
jgi:uncharacterized RDD family membrane protein YckC